ncbi:MAG TPA: hypothetical protein VG674_13505 [Amycolatopsis sp.]|nr:hypothetical protein [Amycolatopsis sp.]
MTATSSEHEVTVPELWAGIDAGKTHHHCVVLDAGISAPPQAMLFHSAGATVVENVAMYYCLNAAIASSAVLRELTGSIQAVHIRSPTRPVPQHRGLAPIRALTSQAVTRDDRGAGLGRAFS